MKSFFFIVFCTILLVSCHKEMMPPSGSASFSVQWKQRLSNSANYLGSDAPVLFEDKVIFLKWLDGPSEVLTAWSKKEGTKRWAWEDPIDIYSGEKISDVRVLDGKLVVCSSHEINVLNPENGQTIWKTDVQDENGSGLPRMGLFGSQIFHQHKDPVNIASYASLCVANLCCPKWDTLISMNTANNDGFRSSFESYALWKNPTTKDSILLFQNQQINWSNQHLQVDVYALNLRTRQIEWKRDSIDPHGESSIQRMLVDGNRVYFMGLVNMWCLDARDGHTIWTKEFNQHNTLNFSENLLFTELVIVDGRLIVKPTDQHLYALDPLTGAEFWKINDTGSSPEGMAAYKDLILFPSSGKGGIFVHRVSDGKLMARLQSPHKNDSNFPGAEIVSGISVDEKDGLLFCSDGYFALCFKINY